MGLPDFFGRFRVFSIFLALIHFMVFFFEILITCLQICKVKWIWFGFFSKENSSPCKKSYVTFFPVFNFPLCTLKKSIYVEIFRNCYLKYLGFVTFFVKVITCLWGVVPCFWGVVTSFLKLLLVSRNLSLVFGELLQVLVEFSLVSGELSLVSGALSLVF